MEHVISQDATCKATDLRIGVLDELMYIDVSGSTHSQHLTAVFHHKDQWNDDKIMDKRDKTRQLDTPPL